MIEFLKLNCYDSFFNKRYWLYDTNKKIQMFTVMNGIVWYDRTIINSIAEIETILNQ